VIHHLGDDGGSVPAGHAKPFQYELH
jgi:hypothetical protein